MSFKSWLSQSFQFRRRSIRKEAPRRTRPSVEALEDRYLLSAGGLDSTFGVGGLQTVNFGAADNVATAVAVQPDGSVVMAGYTDTGFGAPPDMAVARLTSTGQLDPSFGVGGKQIIDFPGSNINKANAVAVESDGSVIVAGYTRIVATENFYFAVARLDSTGQLDPSFGVGGYQTLFPNGEATAVGVQADGSVVVAGFTYNPVTTTNDFAVARLTSTGQLDPSFGVGGEQIIDFGWPNDIATAMAVEADGSVVVGGYAGSHNFGTIGDFMAVARLTSTGQLDPTFGVGGKQLVSFGASAYCKANGVAIGADGSVILAGDMETNDPIEIDSVALVRLTSGGQLDPSFGIGGEQTFEFIEQGQPVGRSFANGVVEEPDGSVIVAGAVFNFDPGYDFALARLTNAGQLDPSFGAGGQVTTSFLVRDGANAVALEADGRIVAAGETDTQTNDVGEFNDFAVARYLGDRVPTTVTVTEAGGTYNGNAFPAAATVNGAGTITGNVTFDYVNTDTHADLGSSAPVNAGHYTVTATYAGDLTHLGSSASASFTIKPKQLAATGWSQGTINIGSNGSIVLHLAISAGQLYGTDTVASLFDGATFTIQIQKADGSVTYGTVSSTARVESDGSLTVSMQMSNALRADLYDAYVNGGAARFDMTALANSGNYSIDEDTMSRLLNNGALKYVV